MLITTNIVAGGLHYRGVQREYRLRTVATYFQQQKGPRIEIALEQIEDECAIGRDHNGRSVSNFVTTRYTYLPFS